MGKRESPIKVCLTNVGKDTETPWAEDLGPAPEPYTDGSRLVRLVNVPFLHAKPTWGDTIVVAPAGDGLLTWDRHEVPFADVDALIFEDGGRWAMIVDYEPHPDSPDAAYATLARACAEHDVVCEAAWGPRDGDPGRVYLAVKNQLSDATLMKRLRNAGLPCELIQIHPTPAEPRAKKPAAKRGAAKPAASAKKPAPKPAKRAPKAAKPAAKKAVRKAAKPIAKKPAAKPVSKAGTKKPSSAAKGGAKKPSSGAKAKKPPLARKKR